MAGSGRVMEIIVEAENGDVVFTEHLNLSQVGTHTLARDF